MNLPQIQGALSGNTGRVEVEVFPESLVARTLQLDDADDLNNPEQIHSSISAIAVGTDGTDTMTLTLGGIQVTVNSSTRFHALDADRDDTVPTSLSAFVTSVQTALAAGHHPAIEALRPAPAKPQSPTDGSFLATEIAIDDEGSLPFISMNVDSSNALTNKTPPPDAWLEVLDVKIALEISNGVTKLREEEPGLRGIVSFGARVDSVNLTAGTASLHNGTVLRIVAGTEFRTEPESPNILTSLAAVHAALAAGDTVRAEGTALALTTDPDTLAVVKVEFMVITQQEPVRFPGIYSFSDTVASVDTVNARFTLGNGTIVHVVAGTLIASGQSYITTLPQLADSIAAKVAVRAQGRGLLDETGPPPVLDAIVLQLSKVK
ncbi:MAG TPA: hypothetical protein VN848_12085 [Gemmatimonadales bacterium]|nr:hypothetical protein [Gemmatimonadales bacterium]